MNSLESTESLEFVEFFCKKITVFEPAIFCVRDQRATSEPGGHT